MESTSQTTGHFYCFGPFCLDAARLLLYKQGKNVALAPRLVRTLLILIQHQGVDLDKAYLMDKLWPYTSVEENNLTVIISALRKVFADGSDERKYIVTIPGRGYRFVADVSETTTEPVNRTQVRNGVLVGEVHTPVPAVTEKAVASPVRKLNWMANIAALTAALLLGAFAIRGWVPVRANRANTLAVLPFESVGSSSHDDYLGLALANAVVARLKNVNGILVRPVGDMLAYQEGAYDPRAAGQTFGASALLTGTVHEVGGQVAVAVRLIRAEDGRILWSEELNGQPRQVLNFQNHIAQRVAYAVAAAPGSLGMPSSKFQYTQNQEAYQSYLRGEYFLNHHSHSPPDEDLKKAIFNFQGAVDKDPRFALAYTSIATAYTRLGFYAPAEQSFAKAIDAAKKAISIDENVAEAHRSLAVAEQGYLWDFAAAEADFRRAIEIDPKDSITYYGYAEELVASGRSEEAQNESYKAQTLDTYPGMYDTLGHIYFYSRNYGAAFRELQGKEDAHPDVFWYLSWIDAFHRAEVDKIGGLKMPSMPSKLRGCELAFKNAAAGNRSAVEACLHLVENTSKGPYVSPYTAALLYAALGDRNNAFDWLKRARDAHVWALSYIKVDPRLDNLRDDARFDSLLTSMGLHR